MDLKKPREEKTNLDRNSNLVALIQGLEEERNWV